MARIAFLSCHLSGTGHLVRVLTLARAARALGHRTCVLSGGLALSHLDATEVVQLPEITVDGLDFATLRRADGTPADAAYMERRRSAIARTLTAFAADVLVTELFPLGRRMLSGEFLHAIAVARGAVPTVGIVCSVRDVPEPKPRRVAEAARVLTAEYDLVLVHGDRAVIGLDDTWPLGTPAADLVRYGGYVARPMPAPRPSDEILVSTGGGALGTLLQDTVAAAARLGPERWRLLVGGSGAEARIADLGRGAPPNLTVEGLRTDYRARLAGAACSVSLAGYNTVMDLAQSTTPAVLVPSGEGGEQEQRIRARHFARFPGIRLIGEDGLTPHALHRTATSLATGPRRPLVPLDVDDGSRAICLIERMLGRRG